jgi:multidrug efflux pump
MLWLFLLFPISLIMLVVRNNPKPFFPSGDPHFVYVYLKMPIGTKTSTTDSVTRVLEARVHKILAKEKPGTPGSIVESVISNVAVSANNPRDNNRSTRVTWEGSRYHL